MKKTVILFFPLLESNNVASNVPYALLYLERMIRHLEINIILIDERLTKDYEKIIEDNANNLLFAGVSSMIGYQITGAIKFSKKVKSVSSSPIIWGGWFPTVFPEMILKENYVDYICIGQGEIPFQMFTEHLLNQKNVDEINGIGYKTNNELKINFASKLSNPINYPKINFDLIDINALINYNGKVETGFRGIDYIATLGCPHNCAFCNLVYIFGRSWFPKEVNEIITDLKYFKSKYDISYVSFSDDNFFANKKFILELCNSIIDSELNIEWEANANPNSFLKTFSDEDINIIHKSGCKKIKIGAESGDQEILDLINKKTFVKNNLEIVRKLNKHNIDIRYFTMVCFPINPDKDFKMTLNLIGKAKLINRNLDVNINLFKPIPKTELYDLCLKHGFKYPENTDDLIVFFANKFTAPWYKSDYHKQLDDFINFYLPFTNPFFFMKFPLKLRLFAFILNIVIFPILFLRIKLNFMKFPFEARLFKKMISSGLDNNYLNSVSTFKSRN